MFCVKSTLGDDLYHTGEFSREIPPSPYIGSIHSACFWDIRENAQSWADKWGGQVVEVVNNADLTPTEYATSCECIDRDGDDCVVTLRIKGGRALSGGWSCSDTFAVVRSA